MRFPVKEEDGRSNRSCGAILDLARSDIYGTVKANLPYGQGVLGFLDQGVIYEIYFHRHRDI